MASFTKRLSITESDSLYSLSDSGGADGYATSKEDTHIWGSALEKKNGRYVFSKHYATFTFEIERASGTDFQNPRNISMDIEYFQGEYDKDGNPIYRTEKLCDDLDLDSNGDGILIYGSKSVDVISLDKTALLRAQVSTTRLYNKGQIRKIWFYVKYNDMTISNKEYELSQTIYFDNTDIKILKGHYWEKDGLLWEMRRNAEYDSKIFFPLSKVQSGSINAYSVTTDGSTSAFYTEENGQFVIKTNALSFLSTINSNTSYRIPSHYFFIGTSKEEQTIEMEYVNLEPTKIITNEDGSPGPKEYSDTYSPGSDNTRSTVINTNDYDFFKNCKKIDEIKMCFGGNFNNKITIHDSSILNIDINDNLPMSFSTGTDGSTRINYISSVLRDKVNLYSHLKGNISRHDQGIIEFIDSFTLTNNNKEIPVSIAVQNNQLVIDDRKDYTCAINNNQLNLGNRAFQNVAYNFKCKIKNKLKVKGGSEYSRTFDISNLSLTAANEIVALKGPIVSISYTNEEGNSYEVPGLIIIKDEVLKFSDDSFEFYNIASGVKDYTSRSHEIGLSTKAEYFQKKVQNLDDTVSVPYDDLKANYKTNYGSEPDEQITLLLGYDFNNSNVYSYTFTYFLGRVAQNFSLKSYSITPSREIKYYLTDNGGDVTSIKSQNSFIDNRKNGEYFSLSRKPQDDDTVAQEQLVLSFGQSNWELEDFISKPIRIENQVVLENMLALLKTNTTNIISLNALKELGLLEIDSNLENLLNSRNITIRVSIEYLYGSGTNIYPREIIHFEIPNITFIPEDFPLGLRKNGVIINPGFDEKLNSNTPGEKKNTFVINVKNVELDNELNPIPTNGLKINFITGQDTSVNFEIYLDKNGVVHLSNCVIDPAPATET